MNASGERKYAIHLLNGEVVQLDAGPKILLTEILRKVDEYCGFSFTKTGCFQLAFIDERKHVFWIKDGGSIADHIDLPRVSRSTIQLYHLPRFYKDLFSQKDPQLLIYLFFDARAQFLQSKFMDMGHAQFARCCACLILLSSSAELSDESTILLAYENQISPSIEQLRQLDISIEELHYIVIKECKLLSNFNHGELILEFLSLVEKSSNFYGSYFYNVSEKSGDNIKLAVNGRALMFFCYADLCHPKRIVYWQYVEKISHDKKQIVLEINARTGWPASPANGHLAKDHVSLSNLSPAKRSSSRMSNNESPMFRQHASFSISTSNSPSRSSQRVVFTCENESLCKAIWDSIIAQHQYFLDQRTSNKAYTTENEASLLRKELAEKLNQELIKLSPGTATALGVVTGVEIHQVVSPTSPSQHKSSCSLSSSQQCAAFSLFKSSSIQPQHSSSSIDSLAFSFSGMPSAKVADGHISRNIHAINCDRTEEDKKRDMELAAKLAEQRRHLEDILLQKLDDLKALCIQEGEITGKLPVEIYKTLLPGEPEPVVKRRVGTAFKFTDEVLQQANLDGNRQAQLELDIELHRKIVAAAERLAKDKNTNKSVRKKRRKDLQAASLKLKGLEKGLHKLRMCNSKPDSLNWLETSSMSQAGSGFSLNSLRTWSNFTGQPLKGSTKSCPNSCPTTPHGSVPDLRAEDVKHKKKTSFSRFLRAENEPSTSSLQSGPKFTVGYDTPDNRSLMGSRSPSNQSHLLPPPPPLQPPPAIPSRKPSCSPKQNSSNETSKNIEYYKMEGRPLQEHRDSPLYANVGYTSSVPYKSAYRQSNFPTINHPTDPGNRHAIENTPISCTRFSTEKSENGSPHQLVMKPSNSTSSLMAANAHLADIVRKMSEQSIAPSTSTSTCTSSSGYVSGNINGSPIKQGESSPSAIRLSDLNVGFSTSSLDRRIVRTKSPVINHGRVTRDNSVSQQSSTSSLITTFPVNDICRPLEPSDFGKYRSISAVRESAASKTSHIGSASSSRIVNTQQGKPPSYPTHNNNNVRNLHTDPHMEALLASIHSRSRENNQASFPPKPNNSPTHEPRRIQTSTSQLITPIKNTNGSAKTATIV